MIAKHAFRIALVATGLLFACSITHRSGDYACTTSQDCDGGRVCSQGFCVVGNGIDAPGSGSGSGSGHLDAPGRPDAPNGNGCPPGCSSCDHGSMTCNIECGEANAADCTRNVVCPAGWSCNIDCKTNQACRAGVTCTNAAACTITCSGSGSCRGVQCGNGPCSVKCSGSNSCTQEVNCNESCMCDIACSNLDTQTCAGAFCGNISCQNQIGGGCTSQPANFCQSTCQ